MNIFKHQNNNQMENSRNSHKQSKKKEQATKITLEVLSKSDEESVGLEILKKLALLSYDYDENITLFHLLTAKIAQFQYESKPIKKTLKALTIISFLLRNGHNEFGKELKKQINILEPFNKIDSHYFEKTHPMNTKKLEYLLQLIKHRARYILMLLNNEQMLAKERKESQIARYKANEMQEQGTAMELRMESGSDKNYTLKLHTKKSEDVAEIETQNDHNTNENTKPEGFILKKSATFQDEI